MIEHVKLQSRRRNLRHRVLVGRGVEYFLCGGSDRGVAVNFAVLHRHELGLVVLHVVKHRAVELNFAAPVVLVAGDLHRALGFKGFNDKGTRSDGRIVKVLCRVEIHDSHLGRGKVINERGIDLLCAYRKFGVAEHLVAVVLKLREADVHFTDAL